MTMRVLIAGGGTGGHLFPGIALAEEFMTRHNENDVLFVGTSRGLEKELIPKAGYPLELIEVSALKGQGLFGTLKNLFKLPRSLFQALSIIRRYRPGIVIAVGGYASGPTALAAWLCRVPVVVQEQNALPGFTTRVVSKFAKRVFTAFDEAATMLPVRKVMRTGNPIRQSLLENFLRPQQSRTDAALQVLVLGGSQGAQAVNEAMARAFRIVNARNPGVRLIHQTGAAKLESVLPLYEEAGLLGKAEVVPFIDDMSAVYARSDLVVCRAGATTVAELTICQKASILIPYPYAADNHQEKNAMALADHGAAVLIRQSDLTPEGLAEEILGLLENSEKRLAMARAAGRMGRPEAAREIADVCVDLWIQSGGLARERKALVGKGGT
jgi:UDP-N-acetylglucosamine--N-acetylmuramyl-(pentapeptide) pyrophosphoryl-undecaprenol N-acetylglucosamine transferase